MLGRASARVFFYVPACDMRKQIDGLANLVRSALMREPKNGDLYVFRNRRRDMIKIVFFDRGGYCLLAKRLEKSTFSIEVDANEESCHIEVSTKDLASLLADARIVKKTARAA